MICITQHGTDGVGHQLYGLFTSMILHNLRNYRFDSNVFMNKMFRFEHLSTIDAELCKSYMIEIARLFGLHFQTENIEYEKHIHAHEFYNIPENYDPKTIYTIDNVFYFDRLHMNDEESILHKKNIETVKKFFINDRLPPKRLDENNIVIHFRLGDALTAGRGESIHKYNDSIKVLLPQLIKKYKNHTFYIHTDDVVDEMIDILKSNNSKYELCSKNTNIMQVISDFVYAKILICGNSSLSKVYSFIGNKELIVVHDDNSQSMPEGSYKISNLISTLATKSSIV